MGWKKVITSLSNALLNSLTTTGNVSASGNIFANLPQHTNGDGLVVVQDPDTGKFFKTGSYGSSEGATNFQVGSDTGILTNLNIQDFAGDVTATVDPATGTLNITFGEAASAEFLGGGGYSNGIKVTGFDTNRFDLVNDDYLIGIKYELNGTTFNGIDLQRSPTQSNTFTTFQTITTSDPTGITEININDSNNPTDVDFQKAGHKFRAVLNFTKADGVSDSIQTSTITKSLNKLNPGTPYFGNSISGISNNFKSGVTIEEGATGSITYSFNNAISNTLSQANGSFPNEGWVSLGFTGPLLEGNDSDPAAAIEDPSSVTIDITETGTAATGDHIEHFNSNGNNSEDRNLQRTFSRNLTRIRSLRYGISSLDTLTLENIHDVNEWPLSATGFGANPPLGEIVFGTNTSTEVNGYNEIIVQPSSEFIYIIYNKNLGYLKPFLQGGINALNSAGSIIGDVTDQFESFDVGNYRVYKTIEVKYANAGPLRFEINGFSDSPTYDNS